MPNGTPSAYQLCALPGFLNELIVKTPGLAVGRPLKRRSSAPVRKNTSRVLAWNVPKSVTSQGKTRWMAIEFLTALAKDAGKKAHGTHSLI